jgi:hypothetical protein
MVVVSVSIGLLFEGLSYEGHHWGITMMNVAMMAASLLASQFVLSRGANAFGPLRTVLTVGVGFILWSVVRTLWIARGDPYLTQNPSAEAFVSRHYLMFKWALVISLFSGLWVLALVYIVRGASKRLFPAKLS